MFIASAVSIKDINIKDAKNSDLLIILREQYKSMAAKLQAQAEDLLIKAEECNQAYNELVSPASNKDGVRISMKDVLAHAQTLESPFTNAGLIAHFFPDAKGEERTNLVRAMSVTLDNLYKKGEIDRNKIEGKRENEYTIKKAKDTQF
jgi:hypothetical protein